MNAHWADIGVRTLLDSSLVLAQVLILNRLGIPFAAITLFAGLAAYGVATALHFGPLLFILAVALSVLLVVVFTALVRALPQDSYLLLTLAVLGVGGALVSASAALGGQLGMSSTSSVLRAQEPGPFLWCAVPLFLLAFGSLWLLDRSQLGLAVEVARMARQEKHAISFIPLWPITALVFFIASGLAFSSGAFQALYTGRVDPNVFRIENAIPMLVATLAAGRSPWRASAIALTFFIFPDLFSVLVGYQRSAMAQVREIIWSVAIVLLAEKQFAGARIVR